MESGDNLQLGFKKSLLLISKTFLFKAFLFKAL